MLDKNVKRMSRIERSLLAVGFGGIVLALVFIMHDAFVVNEQLIRYSFENQAGKVLRVDNDVRIKKTRSSSWKILRANDLIFQNDQIFSSETSLLHLGLNELGEMKVYPASFLSVE